MLVMVAVFLVVLTQAASAEVVVFSQYDTDITLHDGFLHIERQMQLKNVGGNPIIPGELHFKLRQESGGEFYAPAIDNVQASNAYNAKLTTTVIKGNSETDLVISVWDPMLPGFHYDLSLSYDLTFDPKGLLFYEINVPVEKTTIPIQSNTVRFHLPDNYKVTYAPTATVSQQGDERVLEWKDLDNLQFEYSKMPLPKLGIKAVNLFWIVIIVLLVAVLALAWLRRR